MLIRICGLLESVECHPSPTLCSCRVSIHFVAFVDCHETNASHVTQKNATDLADAKAAEVNDLGNDWGGLAVQLFGTHATGTVLSFVFVRISHLQHV